MIKFIRIELKLVTFELYFSYLYSWFSTCTLKISFGKSKESGDNEFAFTASPSSDGYKRDYWPLCNDWDIILWCDLTSLVIDIMKWDGWQHWYKNKGMKAPLIKKITSDPALIIMIGSYKFYVRCFFRAAIETLTESIMLEDEKDRHVITFIHP